MIELKLYRVNNTPDGCQGILITPWHTYVTLERPWMGNQEDISCIPAGKYKCAWVGTSTSGNLRGSTIGILDVPNRKDIRIHAGNTIKDSEGCVLLGFDFHPTERFINPRSKAAMFKFLTSLVDSKDISIEIINLFKEGV